MPSEVIQRVLLDNGCVEGSPSRKSRSPSCYLSQQVFLFAVSASCSRLSRALIHITSLLSDWPFPDRNTTRAPRLMLSMTTPSLGSLPYRELSTRLRLSKHHSL